VTKWNGHDVGLAICFDLRFPEITRELCDRGAKLVLLSAQWPLARVDHFRDFTRVRAMENQMFIASCNSCGDDGKGLTLGGGSTVVGPSGEVMGVLGEEEGILTVKIDLDEVERVRESFPVLKVRRKDLWE
jgi:predicted amidohydrolase